MLALVQVTSFTVLAHRLDMSVREALRQNPRHFPPPKGDHRSHLKDEVHPILIQDKTSLCMAIRAMTPFVLVVGLLLLLPLFHRRLLAHMEIVILPTSIQSPPLKIIIYITRKKPMTYRDEAANVTGKLLGLRWYFPLVVNTHLPWGEVRCYCLSHPPRRGPIHLRLLPRMVSLHRSMRLDL